MNMPRLNIVIAEARDYSSEALDIYHKLGVVQQFESPDEEGFNAALINSHVLVVRLAKVWNAATLSAANQLQYIITPTTGLDHIDLAYCKLKDIMVLSLKGETSFLDSISSTAEHTWALLLASIKRILPASADVKQGLWNRNRWKGHTLKGKTIGIIGLGRVGRQIAHYALAFGMQCLAYDIIKEYPNLASVRSVSLIELLQTSDIITIHIPGAENDNFLSAELLQQTKQGCILINTSRGNVWNEEAVAELIEMGHIEAVATDVIRNELEGALTKSPLWQLAQHNNRVLITPHIAGATFESMAATEIFMANKLQQALSSRHG